MQLEETPRIRALGGEGYGIRSLVKYWGDINGDGISDPLVKFRMENDAGGVKYLWVMYRNVGNGWFYYEKKPILIGMPIRVSYLLITTMMVKMNFI